MNWAFAARALAAAALVACLFLPMSTCTHDGQTNVRVPIRDIEPMYEVLLLYCWPVVLLVAEAFLPRLATSRIVLIALQPILAAATFVQIGLYMLFETPAIGAHVAEAALAVLFVAALIDGILRVRTRMRRARELQFSIPQRSS